MVKQRMASADVAGEVSCLKSKVVGLRLANLYDLNAKVRTVLLLTGTSAHATALDSTACKAIRFAADLRFETF